jgi:hypothetical protein
VSTNDGPQASSLRSINWTRIEKFVGFGRRQAPIVFVGMEEGLKAPDTLDDDLAIRSTYENPIMDLKEAHRGIAGTQHYFEADRAPRQPTWRVMADLMLRRSGVENPTGPERRRYRALRLGRSDGDTLLTELLPYPHPKTRHWLYARFGKFSTRKDYERALLPARKSLLRRILGEHERELVVCYGKAHWSRYEELFDERSWTQIGPFRIGRGDGARVVLTTHFSGRGFNSDLQLAQFAAVALDKSQNRH